MSELYRQSGRRRSAKLVPTFADRGVTWSAQRIPTAVNLFSGPEPLLFIQVAPQLTSRGWVDPVPDPLLLRKSGSVGNRTRDLCICSQKLWPLDHRGGPVGTYTVVKYVPFFGGMSLLWQNDRWQARGEVWHYVHKGSVVHSSLIYFFRSWSLENIHVNKEWTDWQSKHNFIKQRFTQLHVSTPMGHPQAGI